MLAATLVWFFLIQMPGDASWSLVGNFDDRGTCEEMRLNFITTHHNINAQPCQRSWKEGV